MATESGTVSGGYKCVARGVNIVGPVALQHDPQDSDERGSGAGGA